MGWGDRLLARLMQTRLLSSIYIIITTFTFILLLLITSQIVFTNQLSQLRGSKAIFGLLALQLRFNHNDYRSSTVL